MRVTIIDELMPYLEQIHAEDRGGWERAELSLARGEDGGMYMTGGASAEQAPSAATGDSRSASNLAAASSASPSRRWASRRSRADGCTKPSRSRWRRRSAGVRRAACRRASSSRIGVARRGVAAMS
ncbi:MAG TPA: hypothetical protein VKZ63_08375 [Kofleriaceae bacterium]|nr:hypothetical protein [Kofleriaceae bacterium]